jgi:hypothetical protein
MTETKTDSSSTAEPIIRTDLVVPLKALQIYQEHVIKIINDDTAIARRELKECISKRKQFPHLNWDWEEHENIARINTYKRIKGFLYIQDDMFFQMYGRNYYFTRVLESEQKRQFAWRNRVLINDDFTCRKCKHKIGGLEAHHIYSYKYEPELRYDPNNGITFCDWCHKKFHSKYGKHTNMDDVISFLHEDKENPFKSMFI